MVAAIGAQGRHLDVDRPSCPPGRCRAQQGSWQVWFSVASNSTRTEPHRGRRAGRAADQEIRTSTDSSLTWTTEPPAAPSGRKLAARKTIASLKGQQGPPRRDRTRRDLDPAGEAPGRCRGSRAGPRGRRSEVEAPVGLVAVPEAPELEVPFWYVPLLRHAGSRAASWEQRCRSAKKSRRQWKPAHQKH